MDRYEDGEFAGKDWSECLNKRKEGRKKGRVIVEYEEKIQSLTTQLSESEAKREKLVEWLKSSKNNYGERFKKSVEALLKGGDE